VTSRPASASGGRLEHWVPTAVRCFHQLAAQFIQPAEGLHLAGAPVAVDQHVGLVERSLLRRSKDVAARYFPADALAAICEAVTLGCMWLPVKETYTSRV
jgi:hypothetical protein